MHLHAGYLNPFTAIAVILRKRCASFTPELAGWVAWAGIEGD